MANQEGEALERLHDVKQDEQDKIYFKYRKAQSQFLEIMRDLSRFRSEFLDKYSLRSKIMKTYEVHDSIAKMMECQSQILVEEQERLDHFVEASQDLFESKLVNFIQSIRKIKIQNIVKKSQTF